MTTATAEIPVAATDTTVTCPLTITDAAAAEVLSLVSQQDRTDLLLRVYVAGGGCSGLQYGMALDENVEPGDEVFETSGVRLVVDATSLRYLTGSVVDYITHEMGGGFKIENPNATKSCGCGSSFTAEDDAAGNTVTGGCGSCGSH